MEKDIFPVSGSRPLAEIEAPELVAMAKAIEQRRARDIAQCALQTVRQVFRYAVAHGNVCRNPAVEFRPGDILESAQSANYARLDSKGLPALTPLQRCLEV
jgi:integrase-like protein